MNHKFWITGAIIFIILNTIAIFVPCNNTWQINAFWLVVTVICLIVMIRDAIVEKRYNDRFKPVDNCVSEADETFLKK